MKKIFILFTIISLIGLSSVYADVISSYASLNEAYQRILPSDNMDHNYNTIYSMSYNDMLFGKLSWSHTFNIPMNNYFDDIEMGYDGTIGVKEDVYVGRSWYPTQGTLTYNLSELDFDKILNIKSIGFEFDSHVSLFPNGSGYINMLDNNTLISSIFLNSSDNFGAWSFEIPYEYFKNTSRNLTFEMYMNNNDGFYGQWHVHGIYIKENDNKNNANAVPEPISLVLFGTGLMGILFKGHN